MRDAELANGYLFPDEVYIKFDVLGASVMDGVPGHVHRGDVVAERHRCRGHLVQNLGREFGTKTNLQVCLVSGFHCDLSVS